MRWKIGIVLFLVAVGAAAILWYVSRDRANKTALYSNFGTIFPYCGMAWQTTADGPQPAVDIEFARPFQIDRSSDCYVETLEVPLCMFGASANHVRVSLVEDENRLPGAVMETAEVTGRLKPFNGSGFPTHYIVTVRLTGNTVLRPDRFYWVVVGEGRNAHVGWYQNHPESLGTLLRRVAGTGPWLPTPRGGVDVALRVRGRPVP